MLTLIQSILGSPEFATLLLSTFAATVTAAVGWIALHIRRNILRRLTVQELAILQQIAGIAVAYVEQTAWAATSATKLSEALRVANTYLAAYGIKVKAEQLTAIIEAAVYAEATKTTLPTPPATE